MKKITLTATETVTIERSTGNIPLITSNNQSDMYYGIGYCHAMDRGLQMTMMKILGLGKGSEYLSGDDEMLEIDIFFRRMNWYEELEDEINKLNEEEKHFIQAYCDGANEAFKKHKPWELSKLLGYKEFNWQPVDIILLARMVGYLTLAQSQGEIERFFVELVRKEVDSKLLNELFPGLIDGYDIFHTVRLKSYDPIVPEAIKWNIAASAFMASNNWVIAGNRTKSGKPILANDPHLEINRLPSVWYELSVKTNGQYAYSGTMPGLPSLLIGRTNKLSWGATYSFMDSIDLWIEKVHRTQYFIDDEVVDLKIRKEIIKRKKAEPVVEYFYETCHGVIHGNPYESGHHIVAQWSGQRTGAKSIRASFQMWNAQNVKEGMDIIGQLEASFSWVLADSEGNIGMQMSGLLPIRPEGHKGFIPIRGWESKNHWQGFYDAKDLPREYNPERGYIITTNNNLNHLGNVSPINVCMGEYRADRIEQMILAKDKHDVSDSKKMHYDTYSLQAELFMPLILPYLTNNQQSNILKDWDLCYDIKSKGAYVFETIYRSLYSEVFGDILGKDLNDFLQNETGIFIDFYSNFDAILLSKESLWFNGKSQAEVFKSAINNVISLPVKEWGKFNKITLKNMLLGGKLPKFFGFDKGPFPLPGSRATVHQGQVYRSDGRDTTFAPSYRMITDMSEDIIHTNLSGGVSDRRFSKLYNNDFKNAQNGIYKKIKF